MRNILLYMKHTVIIVSFLSVFCSYPFLFSCSEQHTPLLPVSEYRSQIYFGEQNSFRAEISFSKREHPYFADGVCGEQLSVMELTFYALDNTENYTFRLACDQWQIEGDLHYDEVYSRFFFSCSAEPPHTEKLILSVRENGKDCVQLTALPVLSSPPDVDELLTTLLNGLQQPFDGEIYVRLLYRPAVSYYVELIDKNGNRTPYLLAPDGTPVPPSA